MTELKCGAEKCMYNQESYCCKGDITVGGKAARTSEDTCCESFLDGAEKKECGCFRSALDHPSQIIDIDCEATSCMYNHDYQCKAGHVDIQGKGARGSRETSCGTFEQK